METDIHLIPTKCSRVCSGKRPPFEFKVHSSDVNSLPSDKKLQKVHNRQHPSKENTHERPDIEMKRVRYEVMKFSSSKLEGREREEADVALAVSLGAIPPKKDYINYKELHQKRKTEKDVAEEKPHSIAKLKAKLMRGKEKIKKGKGKRKSKIQTKDKNKVAILHSYGKLGRNKKKAA
ncbi:uncharacterized protein C1orf131-like [Ischnura elegans]|uniref:uncharacterized protein C1orf131-like n=1 Tax=Ischnura elegans TaxID=197161 RepID=UPI001ED8BA66|nr:uncharacterized protein C1orf131-like [Ischnura elegans]XP_046398053.1 uncharacterized protein C1orf131-like [Ischnura elegans]XP_046398054.1 uncharacterized protein C1orf131-like [Ischnura elegans]